MERRMFSGGARGADTYWGRVAVKHGYDVIHFSFMGHPTYDLGEGKRVVLSEAKLQLADEHLARASRAMRRDSLRPDQPYVQSLLRRNWWQVNEESGSEAVYAIVEQVKPDGTCSGGTGWAVQLFLDRLTARGNTNDTYPIFAFDQTIGSWFQRANKALGMKPWQPIDAPPTPPGLFTGVGTRRLNPPGREAIDRTFGAEET